MGNFFFKPRPPIVVEEAIEVFETNPTAEVIEIDLVEEPVQYELP